MKQFRGVVLFVLAAACVDGVAPYQDEAAVERALIEKGGEGVTQKQELTASRESALNLAVAAFGGSLPGTIRYVAQGERFAGGESYFPGGVVNTNHFEQTVEFDVSRGRSRQDIHRRQATFGTPGQPIQFVLTLDGAGVGEVVGSESFFGLPTSPLLPDGVGAAERELQLLNPAWFLAQAQRGASARELPRATLAGRVYRRLDVTDSLGTVRLFIDQANGRIAALATTESRLVLRDTLTIAVYQWSRPVDGRLASTPERVALHVGDSWVLAEHRTEVTSPELPESRFVVSNPGPVDPSERLRGAAEREIHQGFAGLGILRLDGKFNTAILDEVAPGVFAVVGSAYNSLLVAQRDRLVLVEAPLDETHSEAILAAVATKFPGRRITDVIATHHHDDHSGGLRRFVAEGARIIVADESAPQLAQAFAAASTVLPDQLERAPREATLQVVGATPLRLDDPELPIVVAPVANGHSAGMLAAVLPRQHVAFESDLWDPPFPPVSIEIPVWMKQFEDFLVRVAPGTQTIVPGHGVVSTRAELQRALATP